jgi:hypothetical protein
LAAAFGAGALVAGVAVALIVGGGSSKPTPAQGPDIDMSAAIGLSCAAPVTPGVAHPDTLLSQLFTVHANRTAYTLGWTIVPFRGAGRSYKFGSGGNLLALEPSTGGRPVGYGSGTVTFRRNPDSGTIDATIALKDGQSLSVGGSWTCLSASGSTTVPGTTVN